MKHWWTFIDESNTETGDKVQGGSILGKTYSMLTDSVDASYRHNSITKIDWRVSNTCRLFLKILSVVDIFIGDGKAVGSTFWQGVTQAGRTSKIDCPPQG